MKNIIKITTLAISVIFLSAVVLAAQDHNHGGDKSNKKTQMMDAKKLDKNNDGVIYECPMKCEAATDMPGECSKCGMKLEKVSVNDTTKTMKCEGTEKKDCCEKEMKNDKSKMMGDHSKTHDSIVREGIIDLEAIDKNKDGMVYQDMMDWNVISDKAGDCPLCGMTLKKVTVIDAVKNLNKHGIKTK